MDEGTKPLNREQRDFYFLRHDHSRLNPDLGGNEFELVYPKEVTSLFHTLDGPEEATFPLEFWLRTDEPIQIDEPVQFTGFFPTILKTDAPMAETDYPLFSRKFLDVLESVGSVGGQVFKTQIEDDVLDGGNLDYPLGRITDRFVLIQFSHLDILDLEKSTYSRLDEELRMVGGLSEVVLKIPLEGLPPAFRLRASASHILVSAAAKEALEAAGIQGVIFTTGPYEY